MNDSPTTDGVRDRFAARGEEALGKLAQDLLENPLVNGALTRALGVREKAAQAQEVAMGALNIPSASDIERLTRRLRSVSQRLEGIEDGLDRIEHSAQRSRPDAGSDIDARLVAIEERLAGLSKQVDKLSNGGSSSPRARTAASARKPRAAAPGKSRPAAAKSRKRTPPTSA